jgi:hypothetical protein
MIDVVVLGCGPIWTGEGAAAPFIGVHILGEIRPAGGFHTLAESRWEDQIGPSIPVQKIKHTTINRRGPLNVRRIGRGMERRPCLWRRKLGGIFDALGEWKPWPIGDRAVHFHGSARSHSSKTPQSTSDRLGGGGIVQGTEKRLRFVVCIFSELWPAGGFKASLNCDRVDEFDRSARSLASKT